jgi:AcrR family transcriptional regulator
MSARKPGTLPFKSRLSRPQRRTRIVEAAEICFAEAGYDATSLTKVAEAADISKAVIYEHFSSKAHLYIALLRERAAELVELVYAEMDTLDQSKSAKDSLRVALEVFFAFSEKRPAAWSLLFRDAPSEPEIAEAYVTLRAMASGAVAERLSRHPAAQSAGLTGADPRITLAAEFLLSGMIGVASRWCSTHDFPSEDVVEAVLRLAWPGLEQLASSLAD